MRGLGIVDWIRKQEHGVGKILILDDEKFDYKFCGLMRYLIQTSWADPDGGLTERHVRYLKKMLPNLDFKDSGIDI